MKNILKRPHDGPGFFSGDDSRELLHAGLQSLGVLAPGFLKTLLPRHYVAFNHVSLEAECSLVSVITLPLTTLAFLPCKTYWEMESP